MRTILSKLLILALTTFASLSSSAREGFSTNPSKLPLAVRNAWESVFFIAPTSRGEIGSAFVVREEYPPELPGKKMLYFLASDHVVRANCGEVTGACNKLLLTGSYGLNMAPLEYVKTNDKGLTIKNDISIVRRHAQADMSLLKVTVDADTFKDIKPIPHDESCQVNFGDAVFMIGFPSTFDRKSPTALPIENRSLTTRRWSKGYVLKPIKSDDLENSSTSYWTGTTADAIQGNSGGPAINSQGKFWGVLDSAATSNDGGYTGDDNRTPGSYHGVVTRCELVQDFINLRELSFLKSISDSYIAPKANEGIEALK